MPEVKQNEYEKLAEHIRVSLASATAYSRSNQKLNSTLMVVSIVGSALTAFLTGLTAVEGPNVIPGILDWQGACSAGAVLSVITAISSGLTQQMNISKRLMDCSQCVGRLRALELVVSVKSRKVDEAPANMQTSFAHTLMCSSK